MATHGPDLVYWPEPTERATVMAEMTPAQEEKLRFLCDRYSVSFDPAHYMIYPETSSMMRGWAEGWVGGSEGTLYVGVDPEGRSHS